MKTRFSIRFLFALLTLAAFLSRFAPRPPKPSLYDRLLISVSQKELDKKCRSGNCVVFVDGRWNMECSMFRPQFLEFVKSKTDAKFRPVIIDISETLDIPSSKSLIGSLINDAGVSDRPIKSFGGEGLVFWMTNGDVVDHAWCTEFIFAKSDLGHKNLTASTSKLFE